MDIDPKDDCEEMQRQAAVIPGKTWGTLSRDLQAKWAKLDCDQYFKGYQQADIIQTDIPLLDLDIGKQGKSPVLSSGEMFFYNQAFSFNIELTPKSFRSQICLQHGTGAHMLWQNMMLLFFVKQILPSVGLRNMAMVPGVTMTEGTPPKPSFFELPSGSQHRAARAQAFNYMLNSVHGLFPKTKLFAGTLAYRSPAISHIFAYVLDNNNKTLDVFDSSGQTGGLAEELILMVKEGSGYTLLNYSQTGLISAITVQTDATSCPLWALLYFVYRSSNEPGVIAEMFNQMCILERGVRSKGGVFDQQESMANLVTQILRKLFEACAKVNMDQSLYHFLYVGESQNRLSEMKTLLAVQELLLVISKCNIGNNVFEYIRKTLSPEDMRVFAVFRLNFLGKAVS